MCEVICLLPMMTELHSGNEYKCV